MKRLWLPLALVVALAGCNSPSESPPPADSRSAAPLAAPVAAPLAAPVAAPVAAPARASWSYEGSTGPARWGDLDPAWSLAKSGRQQSPIDIIPAKAVAMPLPPLAVDYSETSLEILNNGHTIEDDYHGGGTLTVDDQVYRLAQFHFHSPSEHTIDGKYAAMELHLVHKNAAGELAVIGVLIEEGAAHPELALLWDHLPAEPGRSEEIEGLKVNASRLLPASLACWRYAGSLTTPPCSEKVAWFVLRQSITASAEQVAAFRKVIHGNNRPTQSLHGRPVFASP